MTDNQQIKVFPKLTQLYFAPDMNVEDFFTLFTADNFPNLKTLALLLTVPGDVEEQYIETKIVSFYNRF